jgi:hypothetical protein
MIPAGPADRGIVIRPNLPADVASFVGRQREFVALRHLLARLRLLTLTGAGRQG